MELETRTQVSTRITHYSSILWLGTIDCLKVNILYLLISFGRAT
jgi:hypothetical protein